MKKASVIFFILCSCASTQLNTVPTNNQANSTEPQFPSVNIAQYSIPPIPEFTNTVNIRSIPVDSGTSAQQAVIRQGVRFEAPWNGICFNNEAEAVIESTMSEQARVCQNDNRRNIAELSSRAIRDIQLTESNMNLLRSFYQARLREVNITLTNANRTIETLRNSSSSNALANIGLTALGVLIGVGISGAIVLLNN